MANFNIDYLVVAGGGAGGRDGGRGGGGGAGGLLTSVGQTPLTFTTGTQYTLTVGQGGLGSASVINNGDDSELNGSDITLITATGGGRGGGGPNTGGLNRSGSAGGSGGGAIAYYSGGNPGTGNTPATTPSQGNNGGDALTTNQYGAGGGGGAGAAGSNGSGNNGGIGGIGVTNSITVASGTGPYYAGGGAGGGTGSNVSGGSGGGGSFNNSTGIGSSGTNGLGGGGAGGGMAGNAASGGSGVIILRYATSDVASYTTTGITPTEDTTTISGQTILSFTTVGTGTIIFTAPATPTPTPFDGTRATTPVTGFNKTGTSEGLKLPSGDNSNQPAGAAAEQGMIRNDTQETVDSSASAIAHYNGTNWQYFAATESPDVVYPTSLKMYLDASNTTSYPGTGSTWFDLTSNANNGTISGATFNQNGYFVFDGVSDYVSIDATASSPIDSSNDFSVSVWVDPTTLGATRQVVTKYGSSDATRAFTLGVLTDGKVNVTLRSGSTSYNTQTSAGDVTTTGGWYHLVLVREGTSVKIYINNGTPTTATVSAAVNTGGTQPILIGAQGTGTSNEFLGNISKVNVYNTALTSTEVNTLFLEGKGF